jgi:molybdate/tungstate transport system ATP-binding protein
MISVQDLTVTQGDFTFEHFNLEVPSGTYAVLMGATGCGKTSLLEAICGLRPVRQGRILLDGVEVTHLKPAQRGVGYVPQDGALFQTMTVAENLGFALTLRGWPKAPWLARVRELAEQMGIEHLLERLPGKLSGGETQRVALGRALAHGPRVLLLDEPLNALDPDTRDDMYDLLSRVQQQTGVTALHVTHDRDEARRLGQLNLQISHGQIARAAG